ncbi:MAG: peptidylprolyl isomerase [Bacteroidales bacterium]|nr:peptidylprolyl isomerase [Bacteroidales bacterium]MBN2750799.1 peptidylprolyl isomerase [Bacteroidales bacterium]
MNIFRLLYTLVALTSVALTVNAQDRSNDVLLTIGNQKVTRGEFERIYSKNNQIASQSDKKSVRDYLDLFINYKLKVIEAEHQKLDTSALFREELKGYRAQLAQPYMSDREMNDALVAEAYERMKKEVSASHILIAIPENAASSDTLALYNKALAIRQRIVDGEPFEEIARATSDDPSVRRNNGFLGYFTAFQMVYPFETAAYQTPKGRLSMPIRTNFGYHLVKVHDVRPAQGQVRVAHIMVAVPHDAPQEKQAEAAEKISAIYNSIQNNEDFAALAMQNSEDPGSAQNGGELPWFGTGRMVPEFEAAAFALQNPNEVSKPIRTAFGYHIIKLLERKTIGTFQEMTPEIKSKIARDGRTSKSKASFINKLKREYRFSQDTLALEMVISAIDSSFYEGKWKAPRGAYSTPLFSFATQSYTQKDFMNFLEASSSRPPTLPIRELVTYAYGEWVSRTILTFEDANLESKYPDFKALVQEYHDGILLFDITDREVWSKATTDTLGLEQYFNRHSSKYTWGKRVHYYVYSISSQKLADKAYKQIQKRKQKGATPQSIASKLTKGNDRVAVVYTSANTDNQAIQGYASWVNGVSGISEVDGQLIVTEIEKETFGDLMPFADARGQVAADYQNHLEAEWLKGLRAKYPVTINQEVLSALENEF